MLAGAAVAQALAAEPAKKRFDLPADDADKALKRFATQSGVEILYSSEATAGVRTKAVRGEFVPLDAARRLLDGTKLTVTQNAETGALVVSLIDGAAKKGSAAAAPAPTATGSAGWVSGRVFNPAAKEYVRNAEVSIRGTNLLAVSGDNGAFRLGPLPPGEAVVVVNYTGYVTATVSVQVMAGRETVRDIDLVSSLAKGEDIMKLAAYVVSTDREGNAKAIMDQRNSMNISNSVASDAFGDVAEGNVGEFLKNIPGVDIEYNNGEPRVPRLRGLDPQYTGVTLDGMSVASADALIQYNGTDNNPAGQGNRSFGFEQVSLNSIESVEVNFTSSADMEANAPAGTINMRTKHAFDRKGRRIAWQTNVSATSEAFTLSRTHGPDDDRHYKLRPGGIFEISDVFLDGRLGLILNLSESNKYAGQGRFSALYNTTPTAADPRPVVPTTLAFRQFPRLTERFAANFTADFKATKDLVLSVNFLYNTFSQACYTHVTNFNSTRANTAGSDDPLLSFQTNNTASLASNASTAFDKTGKTVTLSPRFEYKRGAFSLEGKFALSTSINDYEALSRGISNGASSTLSNIGFRAVRSSRISPDWTIVQTGGPDWSDYNNFPAPNVTDDGRYAKVDFYNGQLDAKWVAPWRLPTFFKVGGKVKEESRTYKNETPYYTWRYVGPAVPGYSNYAAVQPSTRGFYMGSGFGSYPSISTGGAPAFGSNNYLAALFNSQPENFANAATVTNFYDAFIGNRKDYREQINAAYALANTRFGKLQAQAGIRWEETKTASKEFDPLSRAEVLAAGYTVGTNGRATTIPGLVYQYMTPPRVTRYGSYDNFFPSASLKYSPVRQLQAHFGYSHTVSRPAFNYVSGLWVVDDINMIVNAPNPKLKPEQSDNLSARLAYYFEPVGTLAVGVFQNDIKNLAVTHDFTAAEFGYGDDPDYADYTFVSRESLGGRTRFRGLTFEYSQSLSFLPGALRGLGVSASYTRNYAEERRPGLSPHQVSAGLSYTYWRVSLRAGVLWTPDTPFMSTAATYRDARTKVDLSGSFKVSNRVSLFFQGKNIFDSPEVILREFNGGLPVLSRYTREGADWAFGVKGSF